GCGHGAAHTALPFPGGERTGVSFCLCRPVRVSLSEPRVCSARRLWLDGSGCPGCVCDSGSVAHAVVCARSVRHRGDLPQPLCLADSHHSPDGKASSAVCRISTQCSDPNQLLGGVPLLVSVAT